MRPRGTRRARIRGMSGNSITPNCEPATSKLSSSSPSAWPSMIRHDPVVEAGAILGKVTFVPRGGERSLHACVLDEPIRLDPRQGHLELRRTSEQFQCHRG